MDSVCIGTASAGELSAQAVSPALLVTEIMYNPPDLGLVTGDQLEFLELKNVSQTTLDLSGYSFTNGITYTFPAGTVLASGHFAVLASNPVELQNKYPGVVPNGGYTGQLSNGGEKLTLVDAAGRQVLSFSYGDSSPWPTSPDGTGFSLVPVNPNSLTDPGNPAQWRASSRVGGSPGQDDPALDIPRIVVNEIVTHTASPDIDAVELYNPNTTNVVIGNWYLTDDENSPTKYRIPAGTVIPAGGYKVFTETDFNPGGAGFNFSSDGEEVYLFSGDSAGNLTGYSDGFKFGPAFLNVSFGRYTNSVGEVQFPAQARATFGSVNAGPKVGPVVISKIQYRPATGDQEYVEIKNITGGAIQLFDPAVATNTWKINGIGFSFPTGQTIAAQATVYVIGGDPASFRTQHQIPPSVPIYGPFTGALDDQGERIQLQQPGTPSTDNEGNTNVPYIVIDEVRYNDKAPWPTNVTTLERIDANQYGDDPINWRGASNPSQGQTFEEWRAIYFSAAELNDPSISGSDADADHDGQTNFQEYQSGTNPRDALSRLQFSSNNPIKQLASDVTLSIDAVAGRTYTVQYRDTLSGGSWIDLTHVAAQSSNQSVEVHDTNSAQSRFYRIVTP